ncbi:hypothetical protein HGM15179_020924 [Zosterops borbonicus]|uniref:DUF1518 domain-containing protein n=1 Tax=Zosterops borbonicus TaxID=364589 RepID=A0A8K1D8A8_9PASS|nr:hypothetical protein HGM15179_020924 [Zosterops borbonicus]
MLAQRQRELYSQQHRQRQLMQQRALLMRQQQQQQQNFGNSGIPMGSPRMPQAPPQQFPYPPGYGGNAGNGSGFGADNRGALGSRGMMGAQFGAGMGPGMQQNLFQYSGSVMTRGTAFSPSYRFTLSDGSVLSAHTKCKLCYPSSPELQPFIMGVHVIDR